MGWQDRQYAQEDVYYGGGRPRYRGSGMSAYDVVTKIIIANIIVYLFHHGPLEVFFEKWLIMQPSKMLSGQVWRLFTATYMHGGFMHIFINMLVFYFFGPMLERRWGGRQFFIVYTLGGVVGNIILFVAWAVGFLEPIVIGNLVIPVTALGASGSVMAIMAAGAVYYPTTEVLVYFIFPLQLRTVVLVYGAGFVWNVYRKGDNYGGDLCHLAGLAVGYWWARTGGWSWAQFGRRQPKGARPGFADLFKGKPKAATFKERVAQRQEDTATVDRILQKVADQGLHSLSEKEKATLKAATERLNAGGANRV
jgi:membrane associated rhomboid family serine protease